MPVSTCEILTLLSASMNGPSFPGLVPLHIPGKEPLPPGVTEEERDAFDKMKKTEKFMSMGAETCAFKTVIAGGGGACLSSIIQVGLFVYQSPLRRIGHWCLLLINVILIRIRGSSPP